MVGDGVRKCASAGDGAHIALTWTFVGDGDRTIDLGLTLVGGAFFRTLLAGDGARGLGDGTRLGCLAGAGDGGTGEGARGDSSFSSSIWSSWMDEDWAGL